MTPFNIEGMTQPYLTVQPTLLRHPNIPAPMSGLNPRSIYGQDWWDAVRKSAEKSNNYCCYACGTHKSDTEENWLEGHEAYEYNYKEHIARYVNTYSLCNPCHAYIHGGYTLNKVLTWRLSWTKYVAIMTHGVLVLREGGLQPLDSQIAYMNAALLRCSVASARRLLENTLKKLPKISLRDVALEIGTQNANVPPAWRLVVGSDEFTKDDLYVGIDMDDPDEEGSHETLTLF